MSKFLRLSALLLAGLLVCPFFAQAAGNTEVRVATTTAEPFVMAAEYEGFSIDLLRLLMQRTDHPYQLQRVGNEEGIVASLESGQVQLGIAQIPITADYASRVLFSQPMFISGLQIAIANNNEAAGFFGHEIMMMLLDIMLILVVIMYVVAHFMWFAERRHKKSDFHHSYWRGVWDAFWWSAVTITTVGYGDKAPKGVIGRVIAMLWMFFSLFLVAYFTSVITTSLTVERLRRDIGSVADLSGKVVAVVDESEAEYYLKMINIEPKVFPDFAAAYAALEQGEVDAMVEDAPVLQHYVLNNGQGRVKIVGDIFNKTYYGIAIPENRPSLLKEINIALLELDEDGTYRQLHEKWFGTAE